MSADKTIPVKVALRIRPLVQREKADACTECLRAVNGEPQVICLQTNPCLLFILFIFFDWNQGDFGQRQGVHIRLRVHSIYTTSGSVRDIRAASNRRVVQRLQYNRFGVWPNGQWQNVHDGHELLVVVHGNTNHKRQVVDKRCRRCGCHSACTQRFVHQNRRGAAKRLELQVHNSRLVRRDLQRRDKGFVLHEKRPPCRAA